MLRCDQDFLQLCDHDLLQWAPCPPPFLTLDKFVSHAETRNLTNNETEIISTRCNITIDSRTTSTPVSSSSSIGPTTVSSSSSIGSTTVPSSSSIGNTTLPDMTTAWGVGSIVGICVTILVLAVAAVLIIWLIRRRKRHTGLVRNIRVYLGRFKTTITSRKEAIPDDIIKDGNDITTNKTEPVNQKENEIEHSEYSLEIKIHNDIMPQLKNKCAIGDKHDKDDISFNTQARTILHKKTEHANCTTKPMDASTHTSSDYTGAHVNNGFGTFGSSTGSVNVYDNTRHSHDNIPSIDNTSSSAALDQTDAAIQFDKTSLQFKSMAKYSETLPVHDEKENKIGPSNTSNVVSTPDRESNQEHCIGPSNISGDISTPSRENNQEQCIRRSNISGDISTPDRENNQEHCIGPSNISGDISTPGRESNQEHCIGPSNISGDISTPDRENNQEHCIGPSNISGDISTPARENNQEHCIGPCTTSNGVSTPECKHECYIESHNTSDVIVTCKDSSEGETIRL